MKKSLLIILLLLIGGCTTVPKEVLVEVFKPCSVTVPTKPLLVFSPPYNLLFLLVRDLKIDREMNLAYITKLEGALKACIPD